MSVHVMMPALGAITSQGSMLLGSYLPEAIISKDIEIHTLYIFNCVDILISAFSNMYNPVVV